MNILPKKSWHVKNRKNIERVQRDEAEAERLQNLEHDRRLQAESEARVRELRLRAGIQEPETTEHINLFEKPQDHQGDSNKEHEEEKRLEEAKWQQRHGILNRLVRTEDVNRPWYCQPKVTGNEEVIEKPRSNRITSIYDPLAAIKHAEEIVRARRLEQRKLENETRPSNNMSLIPMVQKQLQMMQPSPTASQPVRDDSSPEIIKIVKSKRRKEKLADDKVTKVHKSKKSKKKHKKCKHHHHHHHHHHHRHKSHKHSK